MNIYSEVIETWWSLRRPHLSDSEIQLWLMRLAFMLVLQCIIKKATFVVLLNWYFIRFNL